MRHSGSDTNQRSPSKLDDLASIETMERGLSNQVVIGRRASSASPQCKRSLWATFKEVTKGLLTFNDKPDDPKAVKIKPLPVVNHVRDQQVELKEVTVTQTIDRKLISSKTGPDHRENRPLVAAACQTPGTYLSSEEITEMTSISSRRTAGNKVTCGTDTMVLEDSVARLRKALIEMYNARTTMRRISAWDDMAEWIQEVRCGTSKMLRRNVVDCCGFPILKNCAVPQVLGNFVAEVTIHMLSIKYGDTQMKESGAALPLGLWIDQQLTDVLNTPCDFPSEFSDHLERTMFLFTPASIECKVAMSGSLLVNHTLLAPKEFYSIHKENLSNENAFEDDYVSFACKLIVKLLKYEAVKTNSDHGKMVKTFCDKAPEICASMGKSLVELGRETLLTFMNTKGCNFIAAFDGDHEATTTYTPNTSLKNRSSQTQAISVVPQTLFSAKILLYLMVILKSHVVKCYHGLWCSNLIGSNKYPRVTRVLVHCLYNAHHSLNGRMDICPKKLFHIVWNLMRPVFMEAFFLDSCENISSTKRWQTIIKVMAKCKELAPEDEAAIDSAPLANYTKTLKVDQNTKSLKSSSLSEVKSVAVVNPVLCDVSTPSSACMPTVTKRIVVQSNVGGQNAINVTEAVCPTFRKGLPEGISGVLSTGDHPIVQAKEAVKPLKEQLAAKNKSEQQNTPSLNNNPTSFCTSNRQSVSKMFSACTVASSTVTVNPKPAISNGNADSPLATTMSRGIMPFTNQPKPANTVNSISRLESQQLSATAKPWVPSTNMIAQEIKESQDSVIQATTKPWIPSKGMLVNQDNEKRKSVSQGTQLSFSDVETKLCNKHDVHVPSFDFSALFPDNSYPKAKAVRKLNLSLPKEKSSESDKDLTFPKTDSSNMSSLKNPVQLNSNPTSLFQVKPSNSTSLTPPEGNEINQSNLAIVNQAAGSEDCVVSKSVVTHNVDQQSVEVNMNMSHDGKNTGIQETSSRYQVRPKSKVVSNSCMNNEISNKPSSYEKTQHHGNTSTVKPEQTGKQVNKLGSQNCPLPQSDDAIANRITKPKKLSPPPRNKADINRKEISLSSQPKSNTTSNINMPLTAQKNNPSTKESSDLSHEPLLSLTPFEAKQLQLLILKTNKQAVKLSKLGKSENCAVDLDPPTSKSPENSPTKLKHDIQRQTKVVNTQRSRSEIPNSDGKRNKETRHQSEEGQLGLLVSKSTLAVSSENATTTLAFNLAGGDSTAPKKSIGGMAIGNGSPGKISDVKPCKTDQLMGVDQLLGRHYAIFVQAFTRHFIDLLQVKTPKTCKSDACTSKDLSQFKKLSNESLDKLAVLKMKMVRDHIPCSGIYNMEDCKEAIELLIVGCSTRFHNIINGCSKYRDAIHNLEHYSRFIQKELVTRDLRDVLQCSKDGKDMPETAADSRNHSRRKSNKRRRIKGKNRFLVDPDLINIEMSEQMAPNNDISCSEKCEADAPMIDAVSNDVADRDGMDCKKVTENAPELCVKKNPGNDLGTVGEGDQTTGSVVVDGCEALLSSKAGAGGATLVTPVKKRVKTNPKSSKGKSKLVQCLQTTKIGEKPIYGEGDRSVINRKTKRLKSKPRQQHQLERGDHESENFVDYSPKANSTLTNIENNKEVEISPLATLVKNKRIAALTAVDENQSSVVTKKGKVLDKIPLTFHPKKGYERPPPRDEPASQCKPKPMSITLRISDGSSDDSYKVTSNDNLYALHENSNHLQHYEPDLAHHPDITASNSAVQLVAEYIKHEPQRSNSAVMLVDEYIKSQQETSVCNQTQSEQSNPANILADNYLQGQSSIISGADGHHLATRQDACHSNGLKKLMDIQTSWCDTTRDFEEQRPYDARRKLPLLTQERNQNVMCSNLVTETSSSADDRLCNHDDTSDLDIGLAVAMKADSVKLNPEDFPSLHESSLPFMGTMRPCAGTPWGSRSYGPMDVHEDLCEKIELYETKSHELESGMIKVCHPFVCETEKNLAVAMNNLSVVPPVAEKAVHNQQPSTYKTVVSESSKVDVVSVVDDTGQEDYRFDKIGAKASIHQAQATLTVALDILENVENTVPVATAVEKHSRPSKVNCRTSNPETVVINEFAAQTTFLPHQSSPRDVPHSTDSKSAINDAGMNHSPTAEFLLTEYDDHISFEMQSQYDPNSEISTSFDRLFQEYASTMNELWCKQFLGNNVTDPLEILISKQREAANKPPNEAFTMAAQSPTRESNNDSIPRQHEDNLGAGKEDIGIHLRYGSPEDRQMKIGDYTYATSHVTGNR